VKDIGQQRIDITTIKMVMKPVQRAVKDVSKSISDSPLYHAALRPANTNNNISANSSFGLASPQSLAPPFQGGYQGNFTAAGLNTALAQAMPLNLGPPTSVPATPLTAALGPAAQATLSQPQGQGDYISHSAAGSAAGVRGMHERLDTMIQHPSASGGGYNNQYGQQYSQQNNNNNNVNSSSNGNSNYAGFPHTARRVDMNR
jgi:hypothetical protein